MIGKFKTFFSCVNIKNKRPVAVFFLICLAIYLIFGTYHISKFFTVDEQNWINERIVQYWQAVEHQSWKKTLINDKPGITLAYVSGLGLIREMHPDIYAWKPEKHIWEYNSEKIEWLCKVFRLPILLFNAVIALYLFWIIKKYLDNKWIALWSTILILLSPVLLGISQIVNPDSLLWSLATASFFSFLAYLKYEEKKLAVFAGFFLGASILTKYTAVILFPFFFLLLLYKYFYKLEAWKNNGQIKLKLIRFLSTYFLIIAFSLVMYTLFLPAALTGRALYEQKSIAPLISNLILIFKAVSLAVVVLLGDAYFFENRISEAVSKLANKTKNFWNKALMLSISAVFIFILINWTTGHSIVNLDSIPFDAKKSIEFIQLPIYQKIILELYPVVFSISPLVIFFLLYTWIKSAFGNLKQKGSVFLISVFIIAYYSAIIKNDLLATVRYSIIIYPLLFVIASIGIYDLIETIKKRKLISKPVNIIATIILIASCLPSLWLSKPFYFDYTNSLLPKKYLITGSWGEGGYEAAQYLNSLPNAENLKIWSDYAGVCEFFKGKCLRVYEYNWKKYKVDYYVLSRRGEILYGPNRPRWKSPLLVDAYKYYKQDNPVWKLEIGGRPGNFVKVYKANE